MVNYTNPKPHIDGKIRGTDKLIKPKNRTKVVSEMIKIIEENEKLVSEFEGNNKGTHSNKGCLSL